MLTLNNNQIGLFLSFADVMSFFISVYLIIGAFEKCQNILFCFSKEERLKGIQFIFLLSSNQISESIWSNLSKAL